MVFNLTLHRRVRALKVGMVKQLISYAQRPISFLHVFSLSLLPLTPSPRWVMFRTAFFFDRGQSCNLRLVLIKRHSAIPRCNHILGLLSLGIIVQLWSEQAFLLLRSTYRSQRPTFSTRHSAISRCIHIPSFIWIHRTQVWRSDRHSVILHIVYSLRCRRQGTNYLINNTEYGMGIGEC